MVDFDGQRFAGCGAFAVRGGSAGWAAVDRRAATTAVDHGPGAAGCGAADFVS
ncbi:MAG: hypothetical protein ACRDQZ_12225 [Mycobacteriales bacterium]